MRIELLAAHRRRSASGAARI